MKKQKKRIFPKKKPALAVEWVFGEIPKELLTAWILSLHGITPEK